MSVSPGIREGLTSRAGSRAGVDVAIAGVALVATLSQLSHGGVTPDMSGREALDLIGVVLAAGSVAPLVVSRRFPLAAFVASTAVSATMASLGYPLDLLIAPAYALYRVASARTPNATGDARATVWVVGAFAAFLGATAMSHGAVPVVPLIHTGLVAFGAWFAGERARLRREQVMELQERARRAEYEAERERLLAVAEERSRIARELHDSAGHAISVIAVRAGGARLRHRTDPEVVVNALTAIEELARDTGEEIDQIVGSLRDGRSRDGIDAPAGLGSLDTLVAHHVATGLAVTVDRAGPVRPMGAVEDRAAYRILQEALTNAARHGTGRVAVRLAYDDDGLGLMVTNPVSETIKRRAGGGHGILGMRERAVLLGGSLDVSRANGEFLMLARLPYGVSRP